PVEDDLGGEPGIGAPEQRRERPLGRYRLGAAGGVLVGVLRCAGDEPPVAVHQRLEGLIRGRCRCLGHVSRLRPSRWKRAAGRRTPPKGRPPGPPPPHLSPAFGIRWSCSDSDGSPPPPPSSPAGRPEAP